MKQFVVYKRYRCVSIHCKGCGKKIRKIQNINHKHIIESLLRINMDNPNNNNDDKKKLEQLRENIKELHRTTTYIENNDVPLFCELQDRKRRLINEIQRGG